MNTKPTPETNDLVKTQLARVGITPSVLAAKLTIKCESLERERDEAREEAETIKEAAWAVVHRWETPLWKDAPATAELINKLRKKLTHNTNFQPT